ncbi:MAG: tRNA (adenosine(37)-N6)-dimethylallyltransferase MiaA [Candidatus Liptonbacteria bacterium]|nr:tRNA (adenosine(37)-N6)-dimethylallyltransferase MiaA [Candidatus Liptonbacteria bacterium]
MTFPNSANATGRYRPKILAVVGPNASGKSDLAIRLARRFGGEIISADSRQVYRGMDIGTGKVERDERRAKSEERRAHRLATFHIPHSTFRSQGIPHHLLDVASPRTTFTATHYQKLAHRAIRDILKRNRLPIICGGTGFYIDAAVYNYDLPAVPPNPKLRARLEKITAEVLFHRLKKLDPRRAKNIDPRNKRRLIRALEIVLQSGRPSPSPSSALHRTSLYRVLKIGLNPQPNKLRERIHVRLLKRLRQGMVAEVRKLHAGGVSWQKLDDFGLEYRYVSRYLRGLLPKEQMISRLETEIWHYAKRQMTWFKRDKEIIWVKNEREAAVRVKKFIESC